MEFIARYWLAWLIFMILFAVAVLSQQMKRMKQFTRAKSFEQAAGSLTQEIKKSFFFIFLGWLFGLLFLLSVVLNIIQFVAKS